MSESKMRVIQGLLDKAASTTFAAEADALFAKAAELMGKYAIDEAALRSADPAKKIEIIRWDIKTREEYRTERRVMRAEILKALGAKIIFLHNDPNDPGALTMTCFATEATKEMAMAILVQAEIFMMQEMYGAIPVGNARAFRRSFIVSYASALAKILKDSRENAEEEGLKQESTSTALVLRDEKQKISDAYNEAFPNRTKGRGLRTQSTGVSAGRAAASSFTGHMKAI